MKKKMNILSRHGIAVLMFACLIPAGANAQAFSDTKELSRSFPVSEETILELENKYGTILIVPWDKDSIQINVDMHFEAKKASKLKKLMSDVNVSFKGGSNYIIARTDIGDGGSQVVSEIRSLSQNLSANSALRIDYTVYMPNDIDLIMSNKYGDIYIDDFYGDVNISLSNGTLKANKFTGNSEFELLFARASVKELGTSSAFLSYAELDVEQVQQLDVQSKSSDIHLGKAGVVKLSSRRDKFTFQEVEYLYGSTNFSEILISDFLREADCDMKYGKLIIDHVYPAFSRINVDSDYTDVSLYFETGCSFTLDVEHSAKTVMMMPMMDEFVQTKRVGEETYSVNGKVGASPDAVLQINAKNKCYIKLASR